MNIPLLLLLLITIESIVAFSSAQKRCLCSTSDARSGKCPLTKRSAPNQHKRCFNYRDSNLFYSTILRDIPNVQRRWGLSSKPDPTRLEFKHRDNNNNNSNKQKTRLEFRRRDEVTEAPSFKIKFERKSKAVDQSNQRVFYKFEKRSP